jgi:hypothetical protein
MCPACIASTALLLAGVMSTGGLTALAAKLLHTKGEAHEILSDRPKRKEK